MSKRLKKKLDKRLRREIYSVYWNTNVKGLN